MRRFTHVINPFAAPPATAHSVMQEITFAALGNALTSAETKGIPVEVIGACFPDDESAVKPAARPVPELSMRIDHVLGLPFTAPFPLCKDVLDIGFRHGTGEYLIFTNMDICPQAYFYEALDRLIGRNPEAALVIPRRTISDSYRSPSDLPAMYRKPGSPHEGFDCFVFPRAWVPRLDLGALCLAIPSFDLALIMNLDVLSGFRCRVLWSQFLTFHLGDDKSWSSQSLLNDHNTREALDVAQRLRAQVGELPHRSKLEYAEVWLTRGTPPPCPLPIRIASRVQQKAREFHARWIVRSFRKQAQLPAW